MIRKFLLLGVIIGFMLSCMKPELEVSNSENVSIAIYTSAVIGSEDPDSQISLLRVMAFDKYTGQLRSNRLYSESELGGSISHRMVSGIFNFYFIANEPASSGLDYIQYETALNEVEFPASAFDSEHDIPMIGYYPDITVLSDSQGIIRDGVNYANWPISLKRLAVRLDVVIQAKTDISASFMGVEFSNIPNSVHLAGNDSDSRAVTRSFDINNDPDHFESATPAEGYAWAVKLKRIILPANVFSPESNVDKAVVFKFMLAYGPISVPFGVNFMANNYTIPINSRLDVNVWLNNAIVNMDIDASPWHVVDLDGSTIMRKLDVSTTSTYLSERSVSRVFFNTNQPSVVVDPQGFDAKAGTMFNVNDVFKSLSGSGATNISFNSSTGEGYIDIETDALSPGDHQHKIYLNANGLRREIEVNSIINPATDWSDKPYVGTFHRWNETGERIIYGKHVGEWTASVEDPSGIGSFVILDSSKSYDPFLNTERTANAELYQLTGNEKTVSGTGDIIFRVGLTSKLDNDRTKPRYARIVVTHSTGVSYLYVRQGETPDYVYRRNEAGTGTNMDSRPYAIMLSPYNLTDPDGTINTGLVKVDKGYRGYVFTQFPTQAGYYFQWGNTAAWMSDNTQTSMPNWDTSIPSGVWRDYDFETCPLSYKRISHGSMFSFQPDDVSISEMAQSLLFTVDGNPSGKPQTIIEGYYADGFFDRRQIKTPSTTLPGANSMVSSGAFRAYAGSLVYHPITNASVFLPKAGYIASSGQYTLNQGDLGMYYSTSKSTANSAWIFRLSGSYLFDMPGRNAAEAMPIRCIRQAGF